MDVASVRTAFRKPKEKNARHEGISSKQSST